jgi:hypothetical protein
MTTKPVSFNINSQKNILYYNSKDLFNYDNLFYYGCKSKPRNIIVKKNIPETDYLFANQKLNEWNISTSSCKKAQLLISKKWVDRFFFKIPQEPIINIKPDITEPNIIQHETTFDDIVLNEVKVDKDSIEYAPELINLKDNQKFRDSDGNIIEIETRGTKQYNNIYFKVSDVSKGFDIKNLNTTLSHKDRGYERNEDYKTFLISVINKKDELIKNMNKNNGLPIEQSNTIKKSLYLTYNGLLRVLFVSRNKQVKRFQDWVMKTLFTIQMGSKDEKIKLGTSILNITEKTYKAVFQKHADKFPSIYLFSLGSVCDLRESFGIDNSFPDDSIVYKYGFTDDLGRRMSEHESKYGKLKNVKIVLTTFHIIDPKYTSDAEGDVRELCNTFELNLQTDGYKELIVLNKKQLEYVKKNYSRIGRDYVGHTQELQNKIKDLKDEIKDLNYENDRLKTIIENNKTLHESELKNKDLQLENKNLQIVILKNNITI